MILVFHFIDLACSFAPGAAPSPLRDSPLLKGLYRSVATQLLQRLGAIIDETIKTDTHDTL
eukprot:2283202-Amphidinium_carterae.1